MKMLTTVAAVMLAVAATSGNDTSIWTDPVKLRELGNERIARSDFREGLPLLETAVALAPVWEEGLASLANALHLQRRLDEAADRYARLLHVAPPMAPSKQQEDAILRFSPPGFSDTH